MLTQPSARGILEEKRRQGKRLAGTDDHRNVLESSFPWSKLAIAVAASLVLISLLAASVLGPAATDTPLPLEPERLTPTVIDPAPNGDVVVPWDNRLGGGPASPLSAE